MDGRIHSVTLDKERCTGCSNCLMRCPTEAIRVRRGRAHIIDERCIDCGECIRVCSNHAKIALTEPLSSVFVYRHRIALPAPALYGQYRNLPSISLVIEGLIRLGFSDVVEVALGADIVTRAIKEKLKEKGLPKPMISSACPTITRLIQLRFPDLIEHIIDVRQPMEVAASLARKQYAQKHSVSEDEIGIFFISPCAAKATAIHNPLGHSLSQVNGIIAIRDIYGPLLQAMDGLKVGEKETRATRYGIGWAKSGGEAKAVGSIKRLAVDGMEDVISVLEEIENGRLRDIEFFEGAACRGGCVGGPLTFENKFIARNTVKCLGEKLPVTHPDEVIHLEQLPPIPLHFEEDLKPNDSLKLHPSISGAIERMERMQEILSILPGYDCGSCGSPTCRSFAEDIVRGYCTQNDCIFLLRDRLKVMAQEMIDISQTKREHSNDN